MTDWTADAVLQALTQVVFIGIFAISVASFIRRPGRDRAEIAALFGSLALVIVLGGITQLTGLEVPQATLIGTMLLLAQPYLLLRLVEHFRVVPRHQKIIGLLGMLAAWVVVIWMMVVNVKSSIPGTPIVILEFGYVEGYASLAFIRAAFASRGVTQKRLVAIALGAGLLALVILLAGVAMFAPDSYELKVVSALLGLGSAVSYYLGFAPPAWLRRTWQVTELQAFLTSLVGRSAEDRFSAALERLGPAAARALGGHSAVVALLGEANERLTLRPDPDNEEVLRKSGIDSISLGEMSPLLAQAWQERRGLISNQPQAWGPQLRQLASTLGGAQSLVATPLVAYGQVHGLLVVFFNQRSIIFESELLLASMAEQAAMSIAGAQLIGQLQEQNLALESASRMKSEFLANMSHELRTPLNAILGFSELLIDAEDGDLDDETEGAYLERIHDSGQHLLELINDVLDLSKIEAGRMELHPERFGAAEAIAQVLSTIGPLAERKQIQLSGDTAEFDLYADAGKFKQILYNLLSNAIKFTPEMGRVSVAAHPEDGALHLTVSDTGIGIAAEDRERVFAEFQQVDSGANRKHEGTGLGLALTKRFVEMHGGRIWLESETGQGASFHVVMPALSASASASPAPEELVSPESGTGPLVLVVEDNAAAAHLMTVYLSRGGYRVAIAADGRQALEKARSLEPAAMTLDVMLPDLDGWQVLRELKAEQATRDIPVIVASIVDDQPLGYALGATDYLVKPVDRELLLAQLARYIMPRPGGQRPTVLVVDDELAARELIAGILEPANFTVEQASSGTEALDKLARHAPDLVLLDLMMPGVSGFDVVTRMRLDSRLGPIPVLIITAKDLTSEDRRHLNGSVAAVFSKGSLSNHDLLASVRQLTAREIDLRPKEASRVSA